MKHCWLVLLASVQLTLLPATTGGSYPSYPPSSEPKDKFLPAKRGETPSCVKDPRLTFCTDPEDYPEDRIVYLLKNKMFDVDTFLQDETRDTYTFEARDGPSYPATMMYNKPSPRPTSGYSKPQALYPPSGNGYNRNPKTINFNYNQPINRTLPYGSRPKYETNNHFKIPTYNSYPARNTSVSPNSFTSQYPTKYDTSRHTNIFKATPRYVDRDYRRYHKDSYNRGRSVNYHRPHSQSNWWGTNRRQKRQADLDEQDLCPSQAEYIPPKTGLSVTGDWMFLVNVENQYRQLVRSETCRRNTCQGSCDTPDGFTAVCQQQYVQKRLVALDGSGSKLNQDTFWFPSCCLCKIRPGAG